MTTRTFMHKIILWNTQLETRKLKERPIKHIHNECFDNPRMEKVILGPMPEEEAFEEARKQITRPVDLPPELAALYGFPLLTKPQEQHLFRKYNFLKSKANRLIENLDPTSRQREPVRRIKSLLDEAAATKQLIANCNIRLAWEFAQRQASQTPHGTINAGDLVSDAYLTLLLAIDCFDYGRGFKFSTYAVWSIRKNFYRSVPEELKRQCRWQTGNDTTLGVKIDDNPYDYDPDTEDQRQKARKVLDDLLRHLTPRRQQAIRDYYGLDGQRFTLEQIGQNLNVSKERVRQLRDQGTKKLKELAAEQNLTLEEVLCGQELAG